MTCIELEREGGKKCGRVRESQWEGGRLRGREGELEGERVKVSESVGR